MLLVLKVVLWVLWVGVGVVVMVFGRWIKGGGGGLVIGRGGGGGGVI